jgi:hypothetical protein
MLIVTWYLALVFPVLSARPDGEADSGLVVPEYVTAPPKFVFQGAPECIENKNFSGGANYARKYLYPIVIVTASRDLQLLTFPSSLSIRVAYSYDYNCKTPQKFLEKQLDK